MVKKIIKVFSLEESGIHKAALLLALASLASGFLGLFRDRLLAGAYGEGKELDLYYAAFRIPDLLYTISITLVSVTVLIPLFLKKKRSSSLAAQEMLNSVFSVFSVFMVFSALILFFFMPYLTSYLAPGFSYAEKNILADLARVLLASPFFLGLSNLVSSVTQAQKKFTVYALSPLLYNISIIWGILVFAPFLGIIGIVYGVIFGSVLHLAIQLPTIRKAGFLPGFTFRPKFRDVKEVVFLSLPRSLGLSVSQILFSFITAFASVLTVGSIAVFNLSYNLQSVAVSVIGLSFSVAAFPTLSGMDVEKNRDGFISHFRQTSRSIIFYALPAAALLIVLRAQIVRVIFGHNNFSWNDTRLTTAAVALFSLSLISQMLVLFFSRACYAAGKTARPIAANILSALIVATLAIWLAWGYAISPLFQNIFQKILRIEGVSGSQALVLPLAFSLGMIVNSLLLYYEAKIEFGIAGAFVRKTLFQGIYAALLLALVSYGALNVLDKVFNIRTSLGIFSQGLVSALIGGIVWGAVLLRLKNEEFMELVFALKQKFWKSSVFISEPPELP